MSQIVFNSPEPKLEEDGSVDALQSQIENLQTTLASLNQVVYSLQEALQGREQEIADLQTKLSVKESTSQGPEDGSLNDSQGGFDSWEVESKVKTDDSMTIVGALMNLYKFIFPPGKAV